MQKCKVTIMGAGVPGLSMALLLAQEGIEVTLCDKLKIPEKPEPLSSRTAALMQNSLALLEKIGIWPDFKPQACALSTLTIMDDSDFPRGEDKIIRQAFNASELGLDCFGYNIPIQSLRAALHQKAKDSENIMIHENAEISYEDDSIISADLVIGADGRHSVVRDWAGIETTQKHYDQTAITCLVSHSLNHENTSYEFQRSGGPCTFVPAGDNRSSVVWVEKTSDAETFIKLPQKAFIQALQARSRDILGRIELLGHGAESWPLMTLKANTLIAPKTALIAEAAHVLSPLGAQGLNLSLRDVAVLYEEIMKARDNGQAIGSHNVLKAYENRRMRDLKTRFYGIDMLNSFIISDNPAVKLIRRIGLKNAMAISPLRQMLMQEGLAPAI
jgi:2-octaprenyl-6-methoxyphenol hydroxylase